MNTSNSQALRSRMRDLLGELGYSDTLLHEDYAFSGNSSAERKGDDSLNRVDLAAFSQTLPNFRTACIGVSFSPDETSETLTRFRPFGAPLIFSISPTANHAEYWRMSAIAPPRRIDGVELDDILQLFNERKHQWSPDAIERAKAIGFQNGADQLDFFDAGYLPAIASELSKKLERDLNKMLGMCKKQFLAQHSEEAFEAATESLFRLLFRLLAAKYLIDRKKQPAWNELSAEEIVREVETLFFKTRSAEAVFDEEPIRTYAWNAIREGLNLANLSPEIIADLYESLLVSKAIRKKYSVHATRLEIAEYMLQQLPIDQLVKNERKVFEPFCGHAPFLTAAMTRMRSLEIEPMTGEHRHDYFQQMLVGMEVSAFSRELGICSLILADDANGDSWQIDCGDSFRSPEFDKHLQWANIVLCNPPFEDFNKTDLGKPENATYDTQAAEALHRVLLHPPKMLGFVLPRLFVDSPKYNLLREKIVENYKDIQVLTLPEKAFRETQTETALLIANNAEASSTRYHSANVSEVQWDSFRISRKPFDAHDSPSLKRNVKGSPLLWLPPLLEIWNYLEKGPKMNDFVEIHRGIEYRRPVKECVFDSPQSHTLPGLQVHDGYLEAYFLSSHQHLSVAPQEMLYKAYQLPWHLPKLLVNRMRSGVGFWRLSGSVDLERLVASQNFYGLWPRLAMPLEALAAVVNSPVANAYSFTLGNGRDNTLGTLKSTPVPEFTSEQTELIVSLVQEYSEKRREWSVGSNRKEYLKRRCKELLYQIDAVVLEAYDLPADLEKELLSRFEGVKRSPLPFEFTGYGEEYRLAKVALEREKIYRITMKLYQSLVDKKYDAGISDLEKLEMKALDEQLNAIEKIYYNTVQPV